MPHYVKPLSIGDRVIFKHKAIGLSDSDAIAGILLVYPVGNTPSTLVEVITEAGHVVAFSLRDAIIIREYKAEEEEKSA